MRRSLLPLICLLVPLVLPACKAKTQPDSKGSVGPQTILARVDDVPITTGDMKELLARYANQPFVLARYSSIEKKKELLDSLIRYDVLALEARKRGYERDPEVQRVAKEKMVKMFTQQQIFDKVRLSDVPDADVEKYYKDHPTEYVRPETVRVSQILVKDKAKAPKILAEVKALPKLDWKGFRELVAKYSEDADSKPRGGDLTQFDRNSPLHPQAVVASAFALKEIGDVSDLVATDKGFVILKLTEHRPALSRSLEEAKLEIQKRLLGDLRTKKKNEFVEAARKDVTVEIYEDQLAKLDFAEMAAVDGGTTAEHGAAVAPNNQRAAHDAGAVVKTLP
jgi:peptidyl-prolyl cis-trans isomerase C